MYQGGYAIYDLSGGVEAATHIHVLDGGSYRYVPGQYVPVGQGFYVIQKHDVDGSNIPTTAYGGDVVFKNSQ